MESMMKEYGDEKGKQMFYATMNKKGIDYTKAPEGKESKYNSGLELKEEEGTLYIEGFVSSPTPDFEGDAMLCQQEIVDQFNNSSSAIMGSLHHDRSGSALLLAEHAELKVDPKDGLEKAWIRTKTNTVHPEYEKTKHEVREEFINGFSLEFLPLEQVGIEGVDFKYNGKEIGDHRGRDIYHPTIVGYGLASRPIQPDATFTNIYFKEFLLINKNKEQTEGELPMTENKENGTPAEVDNNTAPIENKEGVFDAKSAIEKLSVEMKAYIQTKQPLHIPGKQMEGAMATEVKEISDYKASLKEGKIGVQLKAAANLINKFPKITTRIRNSDSLANETKAFWECNGTAIEMKEKKSPVEFKALLGFDSPTNDETTYYQAAAELGDVYDPVIYSMLNDATTLWGLLPKVDMSGRQAIQFRAWDAAGITAAGYNEGSATWTATNESIKRFEQNFAYYRATIEVSDQMIIGASAAGGIGNVWSEEVSRATKELLKKINTDILAGAVGTYTGTDSQYVLGLQFLTSTTGSLYGKARGSITKLQGNTDAMSSAELSLGQMRKMKRTVLANGADKRNLVWVTSYTQADKFRAIMQNMQRIVPTSSVIGFVGQPELDGIPMFEDQHASAGDLFLLDFDVLKAGIQRAPSLIEFGRAGDTRKAAIVMYFNVYCTNPNHNYLSSGLATT